MTLQTATLVFLITVSMGAYAVKPICGFCEAEGDKYKVFIERQERTLMMGTLG